MMWRPRTIRPRSVTGMCDLGRQVWAARGLFLSISPTGGMSARCCYLGRDVQGGYPLSCNAEMICSPALVANTW
jgi:hypothetical protein